MIHVIQRGLLALATGPCDATSPTRACSGIIYCPTDGLRGFCARLWFHCTIRYHTSRVYDRSRIDFYASDLIMITLSLCCAMEGGFIPARDYRLSWARSSQQPLFCASHTGGCSLFHPLQDSKTMRQGRAIRCYPREESPVRSSHNLPLLRL